MNEKLQKQESNPYPNKEDMKDRSIWLILFNKEGSLELLLLLLLLLLDDVLGPAAGAFSLSSPFYS